MNFNKLIRKGFFGWDINPINYDKTNCPYCEKIATHELRFFFGFLGKRLICDSCRNEFIQKFDGVKKGVK